MTPADKTNCYYDDLCRNRFLTVEDKLDKVIELLRGNGTPGLISRVNELEYKARRQAEYKQSILDFAIKNWPSILALAGVLLNLLVSFGAVAAKSAGVEVHP